MRMKILDYVQDLVFIPFDEDEGIEGSYSSDSKAYDLKSVDISIVVRSSKTFYRSQAMRTITVQLKIFQKMINILETQSLLLI